MEGVSENIINGAHLYHERLDGTGWYPFGQTEEATSFQAQILVVADTYDAISSDRVYREKFSPFEAIKELVNEVYAGKLHGRIVFPFVQQIINGYMNRQVRMTNGAVGTLSAN